MTLVRRANNLEEFPSIFDGFFNSDWNHHHRRKACNGNLPAINIKESDNDFFIELTAPGYDKKDFEIEFENGKLKISVKKEEKEDNEKYRAKEFSYSSFERSFNVDEKSINSSKISADYNNGLLLVSLPKRDEIKPKPSRLISIK